MTNYKEVLKAKAYDLLGAIEEADHSNENSENDYTLVDLEDAIQNMIEDIDSLDTEGLEIE